MNSHMSGAKSAQWPRGMEFQLIALKSFNVFTHKRRAASAQHFRFLARDIFLIYHVHYHYFLTIFITFCHFSSVSTLILKSEVSIDMDKNFLLVFFIYMEHRRLFWMPFFNSYNIVDVRSFICNYE